MKTYSVTLIIVFSLLFFEGCTNKGGAKKDLQTANDTVTVADTGFTGIKQYMSGVHLVMEATLKNGVKEGLMKAFYANGKIRQTSWYVHGLREDSVKWYYDEGQVFRSTPYKNDTIEGTQKQYYRNGKLKAKLNYKKGLRTPGLEEFTLDGKLVGGYPGLVVTIKDNYKTKGVYQITLGLTDKSTKVRYYRGDFSNGVFDTAHIEKIKTIEGTGYLDLKKTGSPKSDFIGVIAEILTNFGNNFLVYKKIELPYKDLN
jgi:hypothetical protein